MIKSFDIGFFLSPGPLKTKRQIQRYNKRCEGGNLISCCSSDTVSGRIMIPDYIPPLISVLTIPPGESHCRNELNYRASILQNCKTK